MQCFVSQDRSTQRAQGLTMAVNEELLSMAWLESSCIRLMSGRWFTLPNAQIAVEMCEALYHHKHCCVCLTMSQACVQQIRLLLLALLAIEKTPCVGSMRHGTAVHRHTDRKHKDALWHISSRFALQTAMYMQARQHYQPGMQDGQQHQTMPHRQLSTQTCITDQSTRRQLEHCRCQKADDPNAMQV